MNYKIGGTVVCRWYNTPEQKYYGQRWIGIIEDIQKGRYEGSVLKPFLVKGEHFSTWLKPDEIIRKS